MRLVMRLVARSALCIVGLVVVSSAIATAQESAAAGQIPKGARVVIAPMGDSKPTSQQLSAKRKCQ